MTRFVDLIQPVVVHKATATYDDLLKIGERLQRHKARFPRLVAESNLHLWKPGDPIVSEGRRLLIGVSTASSLDMRLLDALNEAVTDGRTENHRIDVFDVIDCHGPEDFEVYVPGLGVVYQTPVVGQWDSGSLVENATGAEGRNLLIATYDLPADLARRHGR